jgi:hypothetical protein
MGSQAAHDKPIRGIGSDVSGPSVETTDGHVIGFDQPR